jgi:integrase
MTSLIFDQYEERLNRLRRKPATVRNFQRARIPYERFLAANRISAEEIDSTLAEEFFSQLDTAPSTTKLYLDELRAAYRYAHRRGVILRDPMVDVLLPRVPDKEPRIIPTSELRRQKHDVFLDREWLAWHLLVYTGMRRAEILGLRWDDVKLEEGTITITGKGDKLRHIPIHPALGEVLKDSRRFGAFVLGSSKMYGGESKAMAKDTLRQFISRITRGEYSTHDYRRTVASSLYANGVDGDTIDKIMGWAPRVVRTRYYVSVAPVQLQQAILKLYAADPI